MTETREVLGVWMYEGKDSPRSAAHRREREEFIYRHFGGADKTPAFIWKVEFFKVRHGEGIAEQACEYGMTVHCYAKNEEGSRFRAWAKVYDAYGDPQNVQVVRTLAPENYRLAELPPDWLLYNRPRVHVS